MIEFRRLPDNHPDLDLLPMLHADSLTANDVQRYKVEPYVVAADVYSVAPHEGRGAWTWYTGSAAWMYRAAVEGIPGSRREGGYLRVDPSLPTDWPGFSVKVRVADTLIDVRVTQVGAAEAGMRVTGAGSADEGRLVPLDGGVHVVNIRLEPARG